MLIMEANSMNPDQTAPRIVHFKHGLLTTWTIPMDPKHSIFNGTALYFSFTYFNSG